MHGALTRLDPAKARQAMRAGAVLIDIRSDSQIAAMEASRTLRDPPETSSNGGWIQRSQHRIPAPELDDHVILLCDEGYQSSLAAATRSTGLCPARLTLRVAFRHGAPQDPVEQPAIRISGIARHLAEVLSVISRR